MPSRKPDGQPFAVLAFTVTDGKVVEIDILADPARLKQLDMRTIAAEEPERNESE